MVRVLLEVVLPFLAPFLLFFAYRWAASHGVALDARQPWYLLVVCGLVLVCLSLISTALLDRGPPDAVYVPSHLEGGRIVPGELRLPPGGSSGGGSS